MTLSDRVKSELAQVTTHRQSARMAELAALLRFAASVDVQHDGLSILVECDSADAAARTARLLDEVFAANYPVISAQAAGPAKRQVYQIRIGSDSREILRRLGLITRSGHYVVGLPPQVISGGIADIEAAWRGAFLAAGVLQEPGRSASLEVISPCQEAALALVGCARRLGIAAKTKESRGSDRVAVRDGDAVGALLSRMGAQRNRLEWESQRLASEARVAGSRLQNFDDANLRRSARAAVTAAARVERALEILGDDIPEHLAGAGQLRLSHREASLEELGRLADPPMTKDAVAGRIRRLLTMADKRAEELGIPDTSYAVTADIFDDETD